MLRAGDLFTGPYPPGSGKLRRFVVVTDEVAGEHAVVLAYLSTTCWDNTTRLAAGSHPWITQDCVIVYEQTVVADTRHIEAAVAEGALEPREPITGVMLQRIRDGVTRSPETPQRVVRFCADRL